jgi:RNA polymerase sigma-70 factor (ECF subfamily)
VFLQLYRKLDDIESLEHLGFWLRRVPYAATQPLADRPELEAPQREEDPLMTRELDRLLGELTPSARAVMLLRYQEDLDVAEVGAALDMPVNTVKSHIKRSLTALRGKMTGAELVTAEELS